MNMQVMIAHKFKFHNLWMDSLLLIILVNICVQFTDAFNNNSLSNSQHSNNQTFETIQYEVSCSRKEMKVIVNLNDTQESVIYLEKLKGYPACEPSVSNGKAIFRLPLDDSFYICGTNKILNKLTGTKVFYHRIIIEEGTYNTKDTIFVKCVLPSDTLLSPFMFRHKRQAIISTDTGEVREIVEPDILPENFMEPEELDFTDNITARAPYPYLNIKVRQNGVFVDTALNVQPGTPLEMIIYLDEQSRDVYGLLVSFLKVTDNTSRQQEEVIILNGCSIDPYIFGNFETFDSGDSLSAKFRAFKFPDSNYVLFVGTVNVCLKECKGVPCGNGQYGFGKKKRKRSIPNEIPPDPNKVFEVQMTAVLKISESSPFKKVETIEQPEDQKQLPLYQNGSFSSNKGIFSFHINSGVLVFLLYFFHYYVQLKSSMVGL